MIPTGSYTDLTDTPLDFRVLKSIGKDINSSNQQIEIAGVMIIIMLLIHHRLIPLLLKLFIQIQVE